MSFGYGVAAALAAPFVMTLGFIAWENHWKGGAFALNLYKCNLASIGFLILSCTTRSNDPFPKEVFTTQAVGYMILSSTIGIVIGDWTWLEALQLLGARRVILMDSLKPFLAAFLGWLLLDEELRPEALFGIVLTVSGVLVVSLETTSAPSGKDDDDDGLSDDNDDDGDMQQNENMNGKETSKNSFAESTGPQGATDRPIETTHVDSSSRNGLSATEPTDTEVAATLAENSKVVEAEPQPTRNLRLGYPYAILNVLLDTYGAVLIKQHGEDFKVWEINLLRFGFAGLFMLFISLFMSLWKRESFISRQALVSAQWYALPVAQMRKTDWMFVSLGVLLVTFATPSLSNYALFEIALALALTLGSIGPVYSLPLTYLLQHDPPSLRTCVGAFLAVAGVVVLALRGTVESGE